MDRSLVSCVMVVDQLSIDKLRQRARTKQISIPELFRSRSCCCCETCLKHLSALKSLVTYPRASKSSDGLLWQLQPRVCLNWNQWSLKLLSTASALRNLYKNFIFCRGSFMRDNSHDLMLFIYYLLVIYWLSSREKICPPRTCLEHPILTFASPYYRTRSTDLKLRSNGARSTRDGTRLSTLKVPRT